MVEEISEDRLCDIFMALGGGPVMQAMGQPGPVLSLDEYEASLLTPARKRALRQERA